MTALLQKRIKENDDIDIISLRRIENFSQMIHFYLDDVEHISTTNIPIELIPILKDILIINEIKYEILFRPDTDFTYYFVNFSHNMSEEFSPLGKLLKENISIIGFPLTERNNILLNCILFHEIGHQIIEELKIRDKIPEKYLQINIKDIEAYYQAQRKRAEEIRRTVPIERVRLEDFIINEETEKRGMIENINIIFKNWLNEILSDLIAFNYIGVSYLLALSEYSLVYKNPNYCSNTHPPLFLRLKVLFRLYNKKKYSGRLKNFWKYYKTYISI